MEHTAFDTLTRSLSGSPTEGLSRRTVGRLLSALALGGPLAVLGLPDAGAHQHRHKRHKRKPTGSAVTAPPPPPASPPPPSPCASAATCPLPLAAQRCAQATCSGSVCGIGPKGKGTVCRPAVSECDIPEVCDGVSLACPPDQVRAAGTPCTSDGKVCTQDVCNASGQCVHPPLPQNTACGTDELCCSGTCCIAGEFCGSLGRCCRGFGGNCDSPSDCCSGNCGTFGTCLS
jgi:disintegrin